MSSKCRNTVRRPTHSVRDLCGAWADITLADQVKHRIDDLHAAALAALAAAIGFFRFASVAFGFPDFRSVIQ